MGQVNVNAGGGRRWTDNSGGAIIALVVLVLVGLLIWFALFSGSGDTTPDNGGVPANQGGQTDDQGEAPAPSGWRLEYLA